MFPRVIDLEIVFFIRLAIYLTLEAVLLKGNGKLDPLSPRSVSATRKKVKLSRDIKVTYFRIQLDLNS